MDGPHSDTQSRTSFSSSANEEKLEALGVQPAYGSHVSDSGLFVVRVVVRKGEK